MSFDIFDYGRKKCSNFSLNYMRGTLGSEVVSAPTIPKVRGSNPSGGPFGSWPLGHCGYGPCVSLWWKVMPYRLDGKLNRDLVDVACALSNMDFKDPDAYWGREFVRAGNTQIPSIWARKTTQKSTLKSDILGQFQMQNNSVTYLCFSEQEQKRQKIT